MSGPTRRGPVRPALGTSAQIIPIAQGGTGRYTWDKSRVTANTYRIRRGTLTAGRLILDPHIPFHAELLERICKAFDDQERATQ
jgi:hypothetical protein